MLDIPEDILRKVPENYRVSDEKLRGYLVRAIKIGMLSIEGGEFTLSTDKIENILNSTATQMTDKYSAFDTRFRTDLANLIKTKLTAEDSVLALRLDSTFGDNGQLQQQLGNIFDDFTDPDKITSVPNRVTAVMDSKFGDIEKEITRALDTSKEDSPLRSFLSEQKTNFRTLRESMEREMSNIKIALDVEAKLAEKQDEIDIGKKKSTGKGDEFEVDAVERLETIASILGDTVEHTGGLAADGSYAKVGDITIRINGIGLPENLGIAIEAKSGGYALKDLQRQMKKGMEQRNCDAAIGLVTRYGKDVKGLKHSEYHEDPAYGLVSTVEWLPSERDDADWITLEVAYRVTRNRLIAAHRAERDANAVDIDELESQINGIKTQLSSMQSMKVNSSKARELISGVRESLDTLESEIRSHLKRMDDALLTNNKNNSD